MNRDTSRIELTDTAGDMLRKMSDNNPGAITVLIDTMKKGPTIDPNTVFGPYGAILALDALRIYDSAIWILYKYVCAHDLVMMLALLRAVQLGIATESELHEAIASERMSSERKAELLAAVKERLSAFGRAMPDA